MCVYSQSSQVWELFFAHGVEINPGDSKKGSSHHYCEFASITEDTL